MGWSQEAARGGWLACGSVGLLSSGLWEAWQSCHPALVSFVLYSRGPGAVTFPARPVPSALPSSCVHARSVPWASDVESVCVQRTLKLAAVPLSPPSLSLSLGMTHLCLSSV